MLLCITPGINAQTTVKILINQPPVLTIAASELVTQTDTKYILGANVSVGGGVAPYQYLWIKDGKQVGTSLVIEIPKPVTLNSVSLTVKDANNCSATQNSPGTGIIVLKEQPENVAVYPNPATNFIIIDPKVISEVFNITICDSKGFVLIKDHITGKSTLNFSLPQGSYFVKVENHKKQVVEFKKLIVLW